MGGVILLFLLAILIVVLVTPAIRTRFGRAPVPPPEGGEKSPHEISVPRLDDHRARKNTPRDEPHDS